jgi:SAM-dependent methyltransferase
VTGRPARDFSDHFGSVAASYAKFRPSYPAELFDWLASIAPARDAAWDCACGSGQASAALAERFACVIATDASAAQIGAATPHERIHYRVAPAEASGLADRSVDCVTVAQALHWLGAEELYAEVRRVARPGGVLAVWTYGIPTIDSGSVDALVRAFYTDTVGPCWPPERAIVEAGYRTLPFPFAELAAPAFAMRAEWSMAQLLGYLASWSATARYVTAHGRNPVRDVAEALAPAWGDTEATHTIEWALAVRAGRV